LQSTNGTLVNQVRIQRQQLAPGDILRLGSDGPELRVNFVDESVAQTIRPAALAAAAGIATAQPSAMSPSELPPTHPTELSAIGGTQLAPTRQSEPPPIAPAVPPTAPAMASTKPSPARYSEPSSTVRTPEVEMARPEVVSPVAAPEPQDEILQSEEEDPMDEQKLSLLRNLVILMVGLVLVLGGIVISQMQQIADIRQNVMAMRSEAKTAVSQFEPELDKRMTKMETTMDGMDGKIQQAEDRFVLRLEKELPVIMDREVEKQKRKIIQEAQQGTLPH
jgi:hypothetical protein